MWAAIAQSVQQLATDWNVRGIPVWARFSTPVRTSLVAQSASYKMGTGYFPGVKRQGAWR